MKEEKHTTTTSKERTVQNYEKRKKLRKME